MKKICLALLVMIMSTASLMAKTYIIYEINGVRHWVSVPQNIDCKKFIPIGVKIIDCWNEIHHIAPDPYDLSVPVGFSYQNAIGGTYYRNPSTGITTNILTDAEMDALHNDGFSIYFYPSVVGIEIYKSTSNLLETPDAEKILYRSISQADLKALTNYMVVVNPNPVTNIFNVAVINYTGTISGNIQLYKANDGTLATSQPFSNNFVAVSRGTLPDGNYYCLVYINGQLAKNVKLFFQRNPLIGD